MTQSALTPSSISPVRSRGRRIVELTAGHTHGPITRLMSPGDLGELVKPFVFLDYFEAPSSGGPQMADHPHSGIATHTTLLQGSVGYRDSTGKSGTLRAGSVEWMQAGGGVWHGGDLRAGEPVRGYQLWIALPAPLELEPAFSQYLDPEAIESDGRVRVLLGSHGKMRSPIADVSRLAYLHVRLQDGESWRYQPPADHDVAWLAVNDGKLHVAGTVVARRMAVFEEGDGALELRAEDRRSSSSAPRPSTRTRSSAATTRCIRVIVRSPSGRVASGRWRASCAARPVRLRPCEGRRDRCSMLDGLVHDVRAVRCPTGQEDVVDAEWFELHVDVVEVSVGPSDR